MNGWETAQAAAEWSRFERTQRYRNELLISKQKRAVIDMKLGHKPGCSLTRCVNNCQSTIAKIVIR